MRKTSFSWKTLELALAIGFAVTLLWGAFSVQQQELLADKMVRLHIIANSDSEADQTLKLQVRDEIIGLAEGLLRQSDDREDATRRLTAALPELEAIATETVRAHGYAYPVHAELRNTRFDTRVYDGFSLPAGEYLALRLVIGQGEGRNWWCVVFPPLCAETTEDLSQTAMAAGLDREDVSLITEEDQGYVLKFKSIELWERLQESAQSRTK